MADGVRIPAKRPMVSNDPLQDFFDGIIDALEDIPIRILIGIIGIVPVVGQPIANALADWLLDTHETAVEAQGTATTAHATATEAKSGVLDVITGITSGRSGGSSGNAAVREVIAEYHGRITALEGGGVRTQYTTNFTWTNPTPTEHKKIGVLCINAGRNGNNLSGGEGGGYSYAELWTDELPGSVACTIGASNGATTSFGSYHQGYTGLGGVMEGEGKLVATSGAPGRGGDYQDAVRPGGSSAFAAAPPSAGPGADAPVGIPCGGAGGWSRAGTFITAYAGGFPGGGGGGVSNGTGSNPGPGAAGSMFITVY